MSSANERQIDGILLISETNLVALDGLLARSLEKMKEHIEWQVKTGAIHQNSGKSGSTVQIGGSSILSETQILGEYQNFRTAITEGKLEHSTAREFKASVFAGYLRQEIQMIHTAFEKRILIKTSHPDVIDWIELESWATGLQQPWYIRMWARWSLVVSLATTVLPGVATLVGRALSRGYIESSLKKEAMEILDTGVKDANRDQAIEAILRFHAGTPRVQVASADVNSTLLFAAACYIIAVIFYFRPKSAIGIGNGVDSIKRQKIWISCVIKLVPIVAGSGTVLQFLSNWLFGK